MFFLANKEVNSARHETLACPCYSVGNQSVSERLVNPSLMVVLDDSFLRRQSKINLAWPLNFEMACLWTVDVLVPTELSCQ